MQARSMTRLGLQNSRLRSRPFPRSPAQPLQLFLKRLPTQTRLYSTPPTSSSTTTPPLPTDPTALASSSPPRDLRSQFPSSKPPPPPPKTSRRFSNIVYATIFLMLGLTTGQYMRLVLVPPPLPLPNTPADDDLSLYIRKLAIKLPIVQSLSNDPAWESWDAYSSASPHERTHSLTMGALAGSRGIGAYQRIFHNETTKEFVTVIWIGGALAGFPGVTHGGLIASLIDEACGRTAIHNLEGRTGVTANLDINYLLPTVTNSFWVIRCVPVAEGSTARKGFVKGRLEGLDGRVHVEAKGLFVVPRGLKLTSISERKEIGKGF